jgi:hypothetical protein
VVFLLLSIAVHGVGLVVLTPLLPYLATSSHHTPRPLTLVIRDPDREVKPPPDPVDPPRPEYNGQIVEVAPPREEKIPLESDYLSEYDAATEHETRTARFMINPEVLAREYSKEMKAESAEAEDLNVDKPSTGATVGNSRFDPDRDGTMAALPSPWKRTTC